MDERKTIKELMGQFAQSGSVLKISYRPKRVADVVEVNAIDAIENEGLVGDHYSKNGGKRQVTLIQKEHIDAAASMLGKEAIDYKSLRRNIVVAGINLLALKDKKFKIGEAVFEFTGLCHPCSRMEENLGKGGYDAMRGHGGITCKVLKSGTIRAGNAVEPLA